MSRATRSFATRPRAGVTLIEIIVAVVILSTTLLGFAAFTARFMRGTSDAGARTTASDLAVDRIEAIKAVPTYAGIDALGTLESTVSGHPGFARRTHVRRTQSTTADHKTVTVVVTHRSLADSVIKTTVIPSF